MPKRCIRWWNGLPFFYGTVKTAAGSPSILTSDEKITLQIAAAVLGIANPTETDQPVTILRLSRDQAARFLCKLGYQISANRLAKLAVSGDGPDYMTWGRKVVYRPLKLLAWAKAREGAARSHTSEAEPPQLAA